MNGTIFDIKKYAIHDGPNIRTTIFFKGCPLSCWWCHNPEGLNASIDLTWKSESCIGCGECKTKCSRNALEFNQSTLIRKTAECASCLDCLNTCPALAHEQTGHKVSADRVKAEIKKDIPFFDQSKGGVTFSGGEPLMQPLFLLELLTWCGDYGIHRVVDTSCFSKTTDLIAVARKTDLFLIDLKQMDNQKHRLYTGVSNDRIIANIKVLVEMKKNIRFRIPLVDGVNTDDENMIKTGTFIRSLPIETRVDLLPYHAIATGKYKKLGLDNRCADFRPCADDVVRHCQKILTDMGLKTRIGG